MRFFSGLVLVAVFGCSSDTIPGPEFSVALVTPAGENPAVDATELHLDVWVRGRDPMQSTTEVVAGDFDFTLPLTDAVTPVSFVATLDTANGPLIGAMPPFSPLETAGRMEVPMARARTCSALAGVRGDPPVSGALELQAPTVAPAAAIAGTFALIVGGTQARTAVDWLDLLRVRVGELEALETPFTGSSAEALNRNDIVVVGDRSFVYTLNAPVEESPVSSVQLHAGASLGTRVAAIRTTAAPNGAVAAGGGDRSSPVTGATFIDSEGDAVIVATSLAHFAPAIAAFREGALVVSETGAEWVSRNGMATPISLGTDAPHQAVLVSDGTDAVLVGGEDAQGDAVADTIVFRGCPSCVAEVGPSWDSARVGVGFASTSGTGYLIGGESAGVTSAEVDRVTLTGGTATIESWASLASPRARPAGLITEPGVVYIIGGQGDSGPLGSVEACFPDELELIAP